MAEQTGRQRAQRIDPTYFRQRTGLDRGRTATVVACLIAASCYAGYVFWLSAGTGGGVAGHLSTGPVALAHASIENDCGACHQDFTPIDPAAPGIVERFIFAMPVSAGQRQRAIEHNEAACRTCHAVGHHHRDVMTAGFAAIDQTCAGCHADHRGRDHDLTAVAASACSQCHENLQPAMTGAPSTRSAISSFTAAGHGDFASLETDGGSVRFNHAQHLLPGQVIDGQIGGMTPARMPAADRSRYSVLDQGLVQLQCNDCHQIQGQSTGSDWGPLMEPIGFEKHCSACHGISSGAGGPPLPHAADWDQIDVLLAASIDGARSRRTPRPGGVPAPGGGWPIAREVAGVSAGELTLARDRVIGQCVECHERAEIQPGSPTSSAPVIPTRWLGKGRYDHAAHRQIDCRYCHADAYSTSRSTAADDHSNVMIAGIESCVGCHRPAGTPPPVSVVNEPLLGGMPNWASDDCTMCHQYHPQPVVGGGAL